MSLSPELGFYHSVFLQHAEGDPIPPADPSGPLARLDGSEFVALSRGLYDELQRRELLPPSMLEGADSSGVDGLFRSLSAQELQKRVVEVLAEQERRFPELKVDSDEQVFDLDKTPEELSFAEEFPPPIPEPPIHRNWQSRLGSLTEMDEESDSLVVKQPQERVREVREEVELPPKPEPRELPRVVKVAAPNVGNTGEKTKDDGREEIGSLKKEIGSLRNEVGSLKKENTTLRKELDSLKNENENLQKQNDALQKENDTLSSENDFLARKQALAKSDDYAALEQALEEQRRVTRAVQREAAAFLAEMKSGLANEISLGPLLEPRHLPPGFPPQLFRDMHHSLASLARTAHSPSATPAQVSEMCRVTVEKVRAIVKMAKPRVPAGYEGSRLRVVDTALDNLSHVVHDYTNASRRRLLPLILIDAACSDVVASISNLVDLIGEVKLSPPLALGAPTSHLVRAASALVRASKKTRNAPSSVLRGLLADLHGAISLELATERPPIITGELRGCLHRAESFLDHFRGPRTDFEVSEDFRKDMSRLGYEVLNVAEDLP